MNHWTKRFLVEIKYSGVDGFGNEVVFTTWSLGTTVRGAIMAWHRGPFHGVRIVSTRVWAGNRHHMRQSHAAPTKERAKGFLQEPVQAYQGIENVEDQHRQLAVV